MFKRSLTAIALIAMTSVPAFATDEQLPVVAVDVTSLELAAGNSNALSFYPEINDELREAILAELDNKVTDGSQGYEVDVLITAVLLNDSPVLSEDGRFNVLEGLVKVTHEDSNKPVTTIPVILHAMAAETPIDGVTYVQPGVDDFYDAMLAAFAKATETALTEIPADTPESATN